MIRHKFLSALRTPVTCSDSRVVLQHLPSFALGARDYRTVPQYTPMVLLSASLPKHASANIGAGRQITSRIATNTMGMSNVMRTCLYSTSPAGDESKNTTTNTAEEQESTDEHQQAREAKSTSSRSSSSKRSRESKHSSSMSQKKVESPATSADVDGAKGTVKTFDETVTDIKTGLPEVWANVKILANNIRWMYQIGKLRRNSGTYIVNRRQWVQLDKTKQDIRRLIVLGIMFFFTPFGPITTPTLSFFFPKYLVPKTLYTAKLRQELREEEIKWRDEKVAAVKDAVMIKVYGVAVPPEKLTLRHIEKGHIDKQIFRTQLKLDAFEQDELSDILEFMLIGTSLMTKSIMLSRLKSRIEKIREEDKLIAQDDISKIPTAELQEILYNRGIYSFDETDRSVLERHVTRWVSISHNTPVSALVIANLLAWHKERVEVANDVEKEAEKVAERERKKERKEQHETREAREERRRRRREARKAAEAVDKKEETEDEEQQPQQQPQPDAAQHHEEQQPQQSQQEQQKPQEQAQQQQQQHQQ